MTDEPLLQVRDLRVTLHGADGPVRAVDGVSFDMYRGRCLGLVGESGSGKSMTAMAMIGLGPSGAHVETAGSVAFEGRNLLELSPLEMRRVRAGRIRAIFQDPATALNPQIAVADQIAEALPARSARRQARQQVARLLDEVNLSDIPDIESRYPHELSGGQQQRVMIAIALAGDPALLIADEPTTALDMTVQVQILDLLKRLRTRRNMAVLFISHDLGCVANLAEDLMVLQDGRLVEIGPCRQILTRPRSDHARELIACVPRLGATSAEAPASEPPIVSPSGTVEPAPVLSVRNLSVSFPGRGFFAPPVRALQDVSLTVERGEIHGLVGESGSGKSTLARVLVGLVPVERGDITFHGALLDPGRLSPVGRRRIQYIFQDASAAMNPRMTVRQTLSEPLAIHGLYRGPSRHDAIGRLMDEVGLARSLLDRYPHELSGGQRQRVTIARALALEPDLLICDEVTSALDVSVQARLLTLLRRLQAERDFSLIFISHDLGVVDALCHRVSIMAAGRIVESGAPAAIFRRPQTTRTRALIDAAVAVELPNAAVAPDRLEVMTGS